MSKDKSIDFTLNDEKVRKILPKKPSEWSYKEVKTFLKEIVKMDNTVLDFFGLIFIFFKTKQNLFNCFNQMNKKLMEKNS